MEDAWNVDNWCSYEHLVCLSSYDFFSPECIDKIDFEFPFPLFHVHEVDFVNCNICVSVKTIDEHNKIIRILDGNGDFVSSVELDVGDFADVSSLAGHINMKLDTITVDSLNDRLRFRNDGVGTRMIDKNVFLGIRERINLVNGQFTSASSVPIMNPNGMTLFIRCPDIEPAMCIMGKTCLVAGKCDSFKYNTKIPFKRPIAKMTHVSLYIELVDGTMLPMKGIPWTVTLRFVCKTPNLFKEEMRYHIEGATSEASSRPSSCGDSDSS